MGCVSFVSSAAVGATAEGAATGGATGGATAEGAATGGGTGGATGSAAVVNAPPRCWLLKASFKI